jgi:signal transduction histidine kinase
MAPLPPLTKASLWAAGIAAAAAALWLTSLHSYLLFHSISEMFSIAIAACVFMISWNSRDYPEARPFVILGIGYLFVAGIDMMHTLSYEGMNVLKEVRDYPTKLWVAARALQALTTLAFAVLMRLRKTAPHSLAFAVGAAAAAFLFLSIFQWNIFPLCFVEGQGVTAFKKGSEYAISAVLAACIFLVAGERLAVSRRVQSLLISAFALNIASELAFTLYTSAYGTENLIGHFLKILSFLCTYQALIATEVRKRIAMIEELEKAKAALERNEGELRKANIAKDKFFSIIAHDLRNPIAGVLTVSELLTRSFDKLEERKIKELCGLILEGTRQAMELLESILQWARTQTGRIEYRPRPVGLLEISRSTVDLLHPMAEHKEIEITLRVDREACAYADENMLSTVLRNILSNAIKFTPRGGTVVLSARERDECIELSLSDTGIGMRPEELEKLFRIDTHFSSKGTEDERGNGLGLAICKEFVELNRGTISVRSTPGEGSVFTVCLPKRGPAGAVPNN